MEEINVQPKKRRLSCLGWLVVGIVLLGLILFFMRSCNNTGYDDTARNADTNAVVGTTSPNGSNDRDSIDRNAPAASYEEITDTNISIKGGNNYGIYSLGENILFDVNSSTLRKGANQNLKQIAASINKRFKGGEVRIYGFTDSTGSAGYNKRLAEARAATVRNWLATNGGMDANRISLHPLGEGRPVATNTTAQGREQNRRVEIIARKP